MESEYKFQALLNGMEIEFPDSVNLEPVPLSPEQNAAVEKRFEEIRKGISTEWQTKS